MGKKKGAIAAKARARREQQRHRSPSPTGSACGGIALGPVVPIDGQRVHRGLTNLGNTCFLNSIIQCLNVSQPFSDELMALAAEGLEGLAGALCGVFRGVRGLGDVQGPSAAFSPKQFRELLIRTFPWYRGKNQHDAHELLRTLLGSVSDESTATELAEAEEADSGVDKKSRTLESARDCSRCVNKSFGGRLCAATLCWSCRRLSIHLDPFLDIQLALPALAGQSVGGLGITSSMASGGAASDNSAEIAAGPSKAGPAPKPKAQAKRAPIGVWGDALQREHIKALVGRIIVRALNRNGGAEPDEMDSAHDTTDAGPFVEIELARRSKNSPAWGFKWSESMFKDNGTSVLCGIAEDSVLDKWNLKCRAKGDDDLAVCIGDRLVEVNGETSHDEMTKIMRFEDRLTLRFARSTAKLKGSLGPVCDASDDTEEREAESAAAKEQMRRQICEAASHCLAELPEELRMIFGLDAPRGPANGHIQLEDCLRQFSVVEALENDFAPVYQCAQCGESCKTYASRRMWLWPIDLPPLLTLQIKRFRCYQQRIQKSVASVALPSVLNLEEFVITEAQLRSMRPYVTKGSDLVDLGTRSDRDHDSQSSLRYELYGICVHQGASMQSGHYVAYVNSGPSLEHEQWFAISDAKVWMCDRAEVLKQEAYIAFYRLDSTTVAPEVANEVEEAAEAATTNAG